MKIRTLVSNQRYFGLEPIEFRRGAGRALARVEGVAPDSVPMSAQTLSADFKLEPIAADALLESLLSKGLLQASPGHFGDYRLTQLFVEFALARVVPPLPRDRAKEVLEQACRLAAKINAEWTANPLVIHLLAVSGAYMTRSNRVGELVLWPLVKRRAVVRPRSFGAWMTTSDGIREIGTALRELSTFILVRVVTEKTSIERPFAVPFRDYYDAVRASSAPSSFWRWSSSLRRQRRHRARG
jgi:hypothetical protein